MGRSAKDIEKLHQLLRLPRAALVSRGEGALITATSYSSFCRAAAADPEKMPPYKIGEACVRFALGDVLDAFKITLPAPTGDRSEATGALVHHVQTFNAWPEDLNKSTNTN